LLILIVLTLKPQFDPNLKRANTNSQLEKNLTVLTNLVPLICKDKASEIAQRATRRGKTVKQTVLDMGWMVEGNLDELPDPRKMR
jgi:fumarate hydratase class II